LLVGALHFFGDLNARQKLHLIVREVVPVALVTLVVMVGVDYLFYERFVFVPWEFLKFNVIKNMAGYYGTQPWHWYWSQGFVAILGGSIVFFFGGIYRSTRKDLLFVILGTIAVYSLQSHKEFR
jgi:phosphatidylinositol glycan class B